jgi:hypothetical protein
MRGNIMLFYDASYIPWLLYTGGAFGLFLLLTTLSAGRGVVFKDISQEHGNVPYTLKILTYIACVPMSAVLVMMIGSGFYHKIMSL